MNEPITITALGQLVGIIIAIITAIGALWYRVETRISKGAVDAMTRANSVGVKVDFLQRQLDDYKLEVSDNYAKTGYLKDVEERIVLHIAGIVKELHGIRTDLQRAMIDAASNRTRTTRSK